MKTATCLAAFAALSGFQPSLTAAPGAPEDNGLVPVTETFYVNTPETINNNSTESLGVAIARNGNVVIGWEDDGDGLNNLASVWTLFAPDGTAVTTDTEITSVDPAYAGQVVTTRFLSFFRADGSPTPGHTSWGPKIKASLFGDGIGMGATSFELANEVVELGPLQNNAAGENAGDYPTVQWLSNQGTPVKILTGVPDDYAERAGDIRIADWEPLATGNFVIVGESRQRQDLPEIYGGATGEQTHAIVRIVDVAGAEVKAVQLASAVPDKAEMWHGVGVTRNGFAVRFANEAGRATVRLFDNAGNAVSTNLDLATIAGTEIMAAGGRGDSVGFHGNGANAYAAVSKGADGEGKRHVWVTVLNADGTLKWSKSVADDLELADPGACDVGMDASGRVVVVFDDASGTEGNARLVLGRLFSATGEPLGGTFHVSEKELPSSATLPATGPRVSFRGDAIAIVWESLNSGFPENGVVAARFFGLPAKPGSIESVGLTRVVPDTVVINQDLPSLGNWEPYVSVLGTSTFLIEGNAYAQDSADSQRYVVAFQPAAGGAMSLGEALFGDNGSPFRGIVNASRQNGNPGRVAGDARPGAVNFITGVEASPHVVDAFADARWSLGYDRLGDGRYGTIQTFRLDPATLAQTPLSKAQDSAHGRRTSGTAPGNQITRFGGDVVALDNGNFVSVVEDRSLEFNPAGNAAVATIFAPDGTVVKESFLVANGDLWSNVAAYQGGFAVRVVDTLYFFNNAGDLQGSVNQSTSGESFSSGRGDGTRIAGHINQPYVFLAGKVSNAAIVRVAAWDARTREFFAVADVSEGGFRGDFDRATVTADALGRVVVSWEAKPDGYELQQVAARVLAVDTATRSIKPLTASFLPFINAFETGGIRTMRMSVAMTTRQILVAAKGEISLQNTPAAGANSPTEINFYTVISHPDPKDDPTTPVGGGGGIETEAALGNGTVVLTWTGGTPPFAVQRRDSLSSGTWTDVLTTSERTANIPADGGGAFLKVVGQ